VHIRRRIELYLRRTRTPPTRFGRDSIGDPRLVSDMRNGRELRETTEARVAAWLDVRERKA
jgi:hypothetical protein